MKVSKQDFKRFSKQIILKNIGIAGQKKIFNSKVLVVGAGGLGCPLILYLANSGVGTIGIIDDDKVDLSNLNRQILFSLQDIGKFKVYQAKKIIKKINKKIKVKIFKNKINKKNIKNIFKDFEIICDGSDNFETRFLINDICFFEKKILVSAAVTQFDGHISTFKPQDGGPCYRCLHPSQSDDDVWNCENMGILGSLAGTIGSLQASEIIKEILGIGRSLSGWLLIYDGLETTFREVKLLPDPQCPLCSNNASIKNYFV